MPWIFSLSKAHRWITSWCFVRKRNFWYCVLRDQPQTTVNIERGSLLLFRLKSEKMITRSFSKLCHSFTHSLSNIVHLLPLVGLSQNLLQTLLSLSKLAKLSERDKFNEQDNPLKLPKVGILFLSSRIWKRNFVWFSLMKFYISLQIARPKRKACNVLKHCL